MPVFLDQLIQSFYEQIGANFRNAHVRGQLFFVHIGYTRENLEVWRPATYDASRTRAAAFQLVPAPGDAFARSAPLHDPKLETNEEFIAVRVKRRPVILLSPAPPDPGVERVRGAGRVYRRLAVVVPVYNLVNRITGEAKYRPQFVDGLRLLAWPEFLYLPPFAGVLPFPSFARIGEIQAVYQPHLRPCDLRLADDTLSVLQDQVLFLTTGRQGNVLEAYREQLLHQG